MLAITAETNRGVSSEPDRVAEIPSTPCMNSGTYRMTPNIPMPKRNTATEETAMMGSRKSHSGSRGSAARRSINRNAANISTATTSSEITR